jgi:hypothetical protein
MSNGDNTEWMLEISFPRAYGGVEVKNRDDELVISIPFANKTAAGIAAGEAEITVCPRVRVIDGEVADESRMIEGEVVKGESEL